MPRLNVFAYTARDSVSYPPYISVNDQDGRVFITVRESAKPDGSVGSEATVEIPRSEIRDLIRGLSAIERP